MNKPLTMLMATRHEFRFPAIVDEWHDGDTLIVHRYAAPGLIIHGERVRVEGINAPELHEASGTKARDFAADKAPPGTLVWLVAKNPDKYGRFLAKVFLPDGSNFSDLMIAAGYARSYEVLPVMREDGRLV